MTDTPLEAAVTRLERAIARMERTATDNDDAATMRLRQRHDLLRARVQEAVERLDGLIAPDGAAA